MRFRRIAFCFGPRSPIAILGSPIPVAGFTLPTAALRRRAIKPIRAAAALVVFAFTSLLGSPASAAWIDFNDGVTHTIDDGAFFLDNVHAFDGPGSSPTILNIVLGAEIGGAVLVSGTSEIHFSGGITGVAAGCGAGDLQSYDFSLATLSGGNIGCNLVARGNSTILVSGGVIASGIHAEENSTIVIDGTGFNHPYGQINSSMGFLTGVLRDGTAIENQFFRHPGARLNLVPEPSTNVLVGLALVELAFLRRRNYLQPSSPPKH